MKVERTGRRARSTARNPGEPGASRGIFGILRLEITVPAVAGLSFGGVYLLNAYIFRQWGLEFAQVAGPSDVLMAGVQAFALVGAGLVVAAALAAAV